MCEPSQSPPTGLIIAAPSSGSGKTVTTLALLRHFRREGVKVHSFKVGPDYIDPAFHSAAGSTVCRNIDGWAMRRETRTQVLDETAAGASHVIGEGVMGLFDGAPDGSGSTADIAAEVGLPVVLVVDVKGQAASAAAVIEGFADHRRDVDVVGVIFNRVGGDGHRLTLAAACAEMDIAVLGYLPRDERLVLPERHLGLIQAGEHDDLDARLDAAADVAGAHIDTAALLRVARPLTGGKTLPISPPLPPLGQTIAVARDDAFAFAYPAVLDGWRQAGAEIHLFSPLADEGPDKAADAVYLPGGYPELHAGRLAANGGFLDGLRQAAERQVGIFGECGGYMVLGEELTDADGIAHRMAGLLALKTSFAERRLHLGYRAVSLCADSALGQAGTAYRGHEFHYATVLSEDFTKNQPLFEAHDARGTEIGKAGLVNGTVAGSFVHLVDRQ